MSHPLIIFGKFFFNEVAMVTRKMPKITSFSVFSFSMCHIFVCNQVDTRLRWQIEVFTMPHPLRTFH